MKIPIIFINKGQSYYLNYALKAAQRTNPDTEIILITDHPKGTPKGIKTENINEYNKEAIEWAKTYKHTSETSGKEIERFCFERWFILKEYTNKNKIKELLTLDSDVILYTNINEDYEKNWKQYELSICNKESGGFAYIQSPKVLENICDLIKQYPDYPNDTYPFKQYSEHKRIGNLTDIKDQTTYDAMINVSNNYQMNHGIKRVKFTNKEPYCFHNEEGWIKMKCLHFQGMHKFYMKPFYNYKSNIIVIQKAKMMGKMRNKISPLIGNRTRNILKQVVQKI